MKSKQIAEFIAHVKESPEEIFNLQYSKTHFVNMPKGKLIDYLGQEYANELCSETKRKMKMFGIVSTDMLEALKINRHVFSMLLSGSLQSYKHISDRVEFCKLIDIEIKKLC